MRPGRKRARGGLACDLRENDAKLPWVNGKALGGCSFRHLLLNQRRDHV